MFRVRQLVVIALVALLVPVLAACGGEPVAFASIPVFEGASELQAGQNSIADTVAESMKSAVGAQLTSEIMLYELPAGTTWDQVKEFYNGAMGSTDWKAASELATETEAFNTTGWQRGGMASEQVLMVGFMPEMLGNAPVLIVSLFSE